MAKKIKEKHPLRLIRWVNDRYPPIDFSNEGDSIMSLIRAYMKLEYEINLLKVGKIEVMRIALEFGYRQCENGNNIDMAFIEFDKLVTN